MKNSLYIFFLLLFSARLLSQTTPLTVSLTIAHEICNKGAALVKISGGKIPYTISWSNGLSDTDFIDKLDAGNYSVTVKDSTLKDTVIAFIIEKAECPVTISNHFTPNDDNYNDKWQISNTQFYPEFELFVFNKWGQQVHHQKDTYIPWDGNWNGLTAADGTYYYLFYFKKSDKDKVIKGDVSILR